MTLSGAAVAVALLAATPVRAQPTTSELQQEIDKRDKLIEQLSRRVDALEKEMHAKARTTQVANRPAASHGAESQAAEPQAPVAVSLGTPPPPGSMLLAASPAPSQAAPGPSTSGGRSGDKANSEDAMIARALENSLVDQGGLLLPPYVAQFVTDFNYSYQATDQLAFFSPAGSKTSSIVTQNSTRNLFETGLGFRLGLPWATQVNVRVPFDLDYGQATFGGNTVVNQNRGGLGDVSFLAQKQVLYEKGWLPDMILSAGYKAATGSTALTTAQVSTFPFAVGTGSGFNGLSGGFTLLKRQDPLVFLAAFNYTHNFPATIAGTSQTPGDDYEVRISANLAASPDTSLRIAWDTTYQTQQTFAGKSVPGSQETISFLEFGVGSNLTSRIFLDAAIGIGLTPSSPNFRFMLTLPVRF